MRIWQNKVSPLVRQLLSMGLLAALCVGVFGFVGYQQLPVAADKSVAQLVCDGADGLTLPLTGGDTGIVQTIVVSPGTPLYGVLLRFDIAQRVQHGTLSIALQTQNGVHVTGAQEDLTTLVDGDNKGVLFDVPVRASDNEVVYRLYITIMPETPSDAVSLWKADTTLPGFSLTENGAHTQGTLALKYITNHTGPFIVTAYLCIAAFLTLFLLALYALVFIRKAQPQNVFLLCGACIGLAFSLMTPQRSAPDEYVHVASSYALSSRLLGQPVKTANGQLLVRACDATDLNDVSPYTLYAWKDTYEGLFSSAQGHVEPVPVKARTADVFPLLYGAQALGVTLARLLGMGYVPLLLMGRVFNLLQYLVLIYFAIKAMPFAKTTLMLTALLPMSLQLAGSFSYDVPVLGLGFLFFAVCLRCAYGTQPVRAKQLAGLCIVAALLAPAKSVYLLLTAFCCIIPARKFSFLPKLAQKRAAFLGKGAILLCALVMWTAYNFGSVTGMLRSNPPALASTTQMQAQSAPDASPAATSPNSIAFSEQEPAPQALSQQDALTDALKNDILPNGDSRHYFTPSYMLTHIPQTIKLLLNTVQQNASLYLQGLVGGRLGEIIIVTIEISWLYVIALLALLGLSLVPQQGEVLVYRGAARAWGYLLAAGIGGLIVLACIIWTPINYTTVFGIQGRYFLPILPLVLVGLRSNRITATKPLDHVLWFSIGCVDVLVLLNLFCLLAQ